MNRAPPSPSGEAVEETTEPALAWHCAMLDGRAALRERAVLATSSFPSSLRVPAAANLTTSWPPAD
jgi:hypothetical protein